MKLAMGWQYMPLLYWSGFLPYTISENSWKGIEYSINFCIYWNDNMIFCLFFLLMYVNKFINFHVVKLPCLPDINSTKWCCMILSMCYCIVYYIIEDFSINICQDIDVLFSFLSSFSIMVILRNFKFLFNFSICYWCSDFLFFND